MSVYNRVYAYEYDIVYACMYKYVYNVCISKV